MVQRLTWLFSAVSVSAPPLPRYRSVAAVLYPIRSWVGRHREGLWIVVLLLIAGVAHGINMFHFPYYEDDEGTYISQAWSVLREGHLAPYTYWYDHAPVGWLQLAVWSFLTGGFHDFTLTAEGGRVMMLFLQLGSTLMVYVIGRRISASILVGSVAALLFALSPFGIYFDRRVLLDNFAAFWMLLSIVLLLSPRLTLQKVWLSAVALAISALSKELTVFLIPVLAYLVFHRTHRAHRTFALTGWLAIVASLLSMYVLMAVLKGELFPTGTLLGGKHDHVSLIGSLEYQTGRGKDGGLVDPNSTFWQFVRLWMVEEPTLFMGGSLCMFVSIAAIWRWRLIGIMGLVTLSLMAFLARGGEIIEFYLIPYLPLLALNIALVFGLVLRGITNLVGGRLRRPRVALGLGAAAAALCAGTILFDYTMNWQGLSGNHLIFWQSTQADAQTSALAWVRAHVPTQSSMIIDNYMWTDLHDGGAGLPGFPRAQWYWKVDQKQDKAVARLLPTWHDVDYIIVTPQMTSDAKRSDLTKVLEALAHSTLLAHFDTGGWPVDVRKVIKPGQRALPVIGRGPAIPGTAQFFFAGGTNTARDQTLLTLRNPAVQSSSVQLTFALAGGLVVTRSADVDASSARTIQVSDLLPVQGDFGLYISADRPISADLVVHHRDTGTDTPVASRGPSTSWHLSESYTGMTGQDILTIVNPDANSVVHARIRLSPLAGTPATVVATTIPPHGAWIKLVSPLQALSVDVTTDRPVAADRLMAFSKAGYRMAQQGARVAGPINWTSVQALDGGTTRTYLTFLSPSCSAVVAVSSVSGPSDSATFGSASQVVASHCAAGSLAALLRSVAGAPVSPAAPLPAPLPVRVAPLLPGNDNVP